MTTATMPEQTRNHSEEAAETARSRREAVHPERETLLSVHGLTKQFGKFQALKGLDFEMKRGEIISVLGPSGCGKSTLLQLVAGLLRPDGGEIRLNGEVIASHRGMLPPEKRGVNMVFQDYALWPHLSVFDNIAYGLKRQRMARGEMKRRVAELLELLQLSGLEQRLPGSHCPGAGDAAESDAAR
mgnify:FL=1